MIRLAQGGTDSNILVVSFRVEGKHVDTSTPTEAQTAEPRLYGENKVSVCSM